MKAHVKKLRQFQPGYGDANYVKVETHKGPNLRPVDEFRVKVDGSMKERDIVEEVNAKAVKM